MKVYILQLRRYPLVMIGTADEVKAARAASVRIAGRGRNGRIRENTLRGLTCIHMLDGGPAESAAIIARFSTGRAFAPPAYPLIEPTPEFEAWLAEETEPWDWSEAETMGVKGQARARRPGR